MRGRVGIEAIEEAIPDAEDRATVDRSGTGASPGIEAIEAPLAEEENDEEEAREGRKPRSGGGLEAL